MTLFVRMRVIARPEWVFTVLALAAGTYMVFVTGPFQVPDEFNHFYRAYQVSEGQLLATRSGSEVGGWLPIDIVEPEIAFHAISFHRDVRVDRRVLAALLKKPVDAKSKTFYHFPNTALNGPLIYLPQVAGIECGKLLGFSALKMMYAGRLASLLCWICLVLFAIRITPIFKWVIVLLALMPMHLFLAASLSADTVINGAAVLLTALVLNAALCEREHVESDIWIAIACLCVILSMAKLVYVPLSAIVLIIPSSRFGSRKHKAAYCGGVMVAGLATAMLWGLVTRKMYVPLNGSDAGRQLAFILSEPAIFVDAILNTSRLQWFDIVKEFIGVLGWLDTKLPLWVFRTYGLALLAAAFFDSGEGRLRIWQKAWIVGICLLGILLIETAMYLIWTKPRAPFIEGIQGRYLIPFALPAFLLLQNRIFPTKGKLPTGAVLTAYSMAVLVATCLKLYARYYG